MTSSRRRVLLLLALLLAVTLLWARQEWQSRGASRVVGAIPVQIDRLLVQTEVFATDLTGITDLQFANWPSSGGPRRILLVVQQSGVVTWLDLHSKARGQLLQTEVLTGGEMGLLGLAVSPDFPADLRMWTDAVVVSTGESGKQTEVRAWQLPATWEALQAGEQAVQLAPVLHVQQPYTNHNGGQLRFGPDRLLYIATGDGGAGGDPHGHGQRLDTLLGKMLRIDVLQPPAGQAYGIPPDNPFVGQQGAKPEIFAYGLRNPWRFSFAPDGRLWTADVGQDRVEEVDVVSKGANLGWNIQEGQLCFGALTCSDAGLTGPVYAHDHSFGVSITGGFVYRGSKIPELKDRYVFADFGVPSLRALTAQTMQGGQVRDGGWPGKSEAIGRHDGLCSTLGEDPDGELWLGDYSGRVLRIIPAAKAP